MRAVVQRVRSAVVHAGDERVAGIGTGLAVVVGIGSADRAEDAERLARKIVELRVFEDERGRLHHSVTDIGGAVLAVPQFTLYGDIRRGRRPDFTHAAPPDRGRALFDVLCGALRATGVLVETGRFGAHMRIDLEADGPVTIVMTSDGWAEGDL
ncbi:MAG TPA: D-aminoacyl-tRNA deacylase [Candidatus Limnocylindria bacterium]|nr:D-aminoacyl-tRNA deacylase [Candidatus Limnocylindria bacterium]